MASKSSKRGAVGVAIALAGLLIAWIVSRKSQSLKNPQELDQMIQSKLIAAGFGKNQARTWAAVARHETADYTSNLFLKCSNLFGMIRVKQRQTTQIGECPGKYDVPAQTFGSYSNPASAVDDLILYLRARKYPDDFDSVESQIAFMKGKGYFTGSEIAYRDSVLIRLQRMTA